MANGGFAAGSCSFWAALVLGSSLLGVIMPTVSEADESSDSKLNQQQVVDSAGDRSIYPDYCWFDGLENRILMEYPELQEQIKLHAAALNEEKNYLKAADLHRQIFKRVYELELAKLTATSGASPAKEEAGEQVPATSTEEPQIDNAEHKAAYKLFDLWANTPGDFERANNEYDNYLEPYLMESHIEFWSYCLEDRVDCDAILGQLMVLAADQELGPIELLQVSANIILLMNSHKADLVLERLTDREVIKLEQSEDEDAVYEKMLAKIVKLIETDEDFNEAAFHYVFTNTEQIHKIIDPKIETYFAHEIAKFGSDGGANGVGLADNDSAGVAKSTTSA